VIFETCLTIQLKNDGQEGDFFKNANIFE